MPLDAWSTFEIRLAKFSNEPLNAAASIACLLAPASEKRLV
jgi:hypothetical protein